VQMWVWMTRYENGGDYLPHILIYFFCRIQSRSDMDSNANTDFFRCQKWHGLGPVSERKRTFLKSDNMCLRVVFYDEKQFKPKS